MVAERSSNVEITRASLLSRAPTHQKWVKLTNADIQTLRIVPDYEAQGIYFLNGHPIEFVYVIGPVVAIDHVTTRWNTHFSTFEIDDGSGSTIGVKISYIRNRQSSTVVEDEDGSESDEPNGGGERDAWLLKAPALQTRTFETVVPGLVIKSSVAGYQVSADGVPLDVGSVLKVKGKLSRFRGLFQIDLLQVRIVRSLDEEVAAWEDYSHFSRNVLSKPWLPTAEDHKAVEEQERRQEIQQGILAGRKQRNDAARQKHQEKLEQLAKRMEARLAAQAEEMDGNALDRAGWKPKASHGPSHRFVKRRPNTHGALIINLDLKNTTDDGQWAIPGTNNERIHPSKIPPPAIKVARLADGAWVDTQESSSDDAGIDTTDTVKRKGRRRRRKRRQQERSLQ